MKPYPVHKESTNKLLHKALVISCKSYRRYLDNDSPIVSTSHYVLHDLYMTYGQAPVDSEIDRQFASIKKEQ